MGISLVTVRVGKRYRLTNNGETTDFQVLEIHNDRDFRIKDLTTLDIYDFSSLVQFGRGKDYELEEL